MSALTEAALSYGERRWPVFPLRRRDKIPLISKEAGGNGVHDATTNPAQIEAWWSDHPDANIGLACGVAFWALDIEFDGFEADKPDGADTLAALQKRYGPLPETVRQLTGSLGWHRLYKPDSRIRNGVKPLPGIDTRSAGGYIVAPPSVHPCGRRYCWSVGPDEAEIATAPEWLVALLEPVAEPEPAPARPIRVDHLPRYAQAALERACERIEKAAFGQQCDTLEHQAFGIGRLVGGGVIPRTEARAALVAAGGRMPSATGRHKDGKPYRPWTGREIAWRVDRALSSGERQPRTPETRP